MTSLDEASTGVLGGKLVQRGERQELHPVDAVQLVGRHAPVDLVDDGRGPAIAIRHRFGE